MIHDDIAFYCGNCEEVRFWSVEHALSDRYKVTHVFVCERCGLRVPVNMMELYQKRVK